MAPIAFEIHETRPDGLMAEDEFREAFTRQYRSIYTSATLEKAITQFLEQLRKDLPDRDVETVKNIIYDILGPQGNQTKAVERFIQTYNSGFLFNDMDWRDFPFKNISSNPGVLAKIIAEKGELYISYPDKMPFFENIFDFPLEGFQHADVNPPARLLAYYLKKVPYDEQLVRESIAYYRSCPPEEKAGVFAILYKVLNRLE